MRQVDAAAVVLQAYFAIPRSSSYNEKVRFDERVSARACGLAAALGRGTGCLTIFPTSGTNRTVEAFLLSAAAVAVEKLAVLSGCCLRWRRRRRE